MLGFKINWAGIIARQRVCFPHIRQCRHLFTCAEPALQSNTKSQCYFACVCALRLSLPQGHSQYCTVVSRDCFSEEIWLIGKGKKTWLVAAWPRKTEVVGGSEHSDAEIWQSILFWAPNNKIIMHCTMKRPLSGARPPSPKCSQARQCWLSITDLIHPQSMQITYIHLIYVKN